jgi:peroxiredoxin Q/BCP
MLTEGTKAPDISAVTTNGNTISLSDYMGRNNVVLFFYPEDDTSGCTYEACSFRDAKGDYDATDTVILGISTDDQASHQAFTSKYDLNYPLLVDTDRTICKAFDVPCDPWAKRVTYLIDTDGMIAKVWEKVDVRVHTAEVLEAIGEMKK